jgi:hypothetical protein
MAGGDSARGERERGTGERRPGDGRCGRCAAAERMLLKLRRERWGRQRGLTPRVLRLASGPHPGIQRGKGEQVSSPWRRPAVLVQAGRASLRHVAVADFQLLFLAAAALWCALEHRSRSTATTNGDKTNKQTAAT